MGTEWSCDGFVRFRRALAHWLLMSVIATSIEPQRVTRIFLDCRDAPPDPADLLRIERAIEDSAALASFAEEAPGQTEAICDLTAKARVPEVGYRPGEPAWLRRPFMPAETTPSVDSPHTEISGHQVGETTVSDDWGHSLPPGGGQTAAGGDANV